VKAEGTIRRVRRELYKLSSESEEPLGRYAYIAALALQWASEDVAWKALPKEIAEIAEALKS
jgi:hypothetical protein